MKFTRELLTQHEREQIEFYLFSIAYLKERREAGDSLLDYPINFAAMKVCEIIQDAIDKIE